MGLPVPSFAALASGDQPASLLDQNFAALGAASVIACTATGANMVLLTPVANYFTPTGLTDNSPIVSWIQQTTSTGSVTINIASLGNIAAYKGNGAIALGAGDLVAGQSYVARYNHNLNAGAGGFVVDVVSVGEAPTGGLVYGRANPGGWVRAVALAGDTMTGALILNADPSTGLGAATKQYVDSKTGTGGGGGATPPMPGMDNNLYGIMNQAWTLVPPASSALPLINGTAAAGTANVWSRGDHVHPTDTSRAPIASPTLTGVPAAPTAAIGTATTQLATCQYVLAEPLNLFAPPTGAVNFNNQSITTLANPVNPQDGVNKQYADATIQGMQLKPTCRLATTGPLPTNTYNNGTAGVGATLTATANGALLIDSVPVAVNDIVLIKNEAAQQNNGQYIVTQPGTSTLPYILTRSTSMNSAAQFPGAAFVISAGSGNTSTTWLANPTTPVTVGTTAIPITQINAPSALIAGNGINITGNTVSAVGVANQIGVSGSGIGIAATYVGQGSLTTLGTVTTGTWNATAIGVAYGGTGAASLTGYLKGSGTSPFTAVAQIPSTDVSGMPAASTVTPLVDSGSGAIGTSLAYARADHVHPASGGGGGGIVAVNVYSSSQTITIPAGATQAMVIMWGASGGSGGVNSGASVGTAGGGYLEKYLTGLTAGNTLIYTQGAAGTAGPAATAGGNGGTTTLASGTQTIGTLTCNGSVGSPAGASGNQNGPAGGTATGGDINIKGPNAPSLTPTPSNCYGMGSSNFYSVGANGINASGAQAGNAGNPGGLKITWMA